MRFVALAAILLSLPMFVAWLQAQKKNRNIAMALLGALVFAYGRLQVDGAIYTMPIWPGTSRGILISPADTLALALIFTRKRSGKIMPFTVLMASYMAVLVVSLAFSRTWIASSFSVWDFLRVFLVFLAVAGEIERPAAYRALISGLSIGLTIQAGFVIQQKLAGVVQAAGSGTHQNGLGMVTEIVLLNLVVAMLEGERSWLVKLGVVAGLVIVAGGGSRATMALTGGMIALLIILSLIRNRTRGKVAIAAAGAALLVAAIPFAAFTLKERFGNESLFTEEEQRDAMERAARSISSDYPLGIGANQYAHVSNVDGYAARANISWFGANRAVPVHNAYLLSRVETGYHGEAVFALLLLVPMIAGFRHTFRYRRSPSDGWALGSATAMAAIAVHSFVEFGATTYLVQLPLAINMAIIAGRIRASRIERAAERAAVNGAGGEGRGTLSGLARLPRPSSTGLVARLDGISTDGGLPTRINQETRR